MPSAEAGPHAATRIAVVGAGLAGLAAAWWLARRHRVTVFERLPRPGFTARSVAVRWRDRDLRIDVPLRVFYPGYYPTLVKLYRELGVASEPVSYAASFMRADGRLYFRYRNLQVHDDSIGVMAPQDLLLGGGIAWRIATALLRFGRHAPRALERGALAGRTIGEFVEAARFAPDFVDGFLLPAIATVCTCTHAQAREFPAETIVDYLARGLARQSVRRALHGADEVERRLLAALPDVRCDARLEGVERTPAGVTLHFDDGPPQVFDHVVLATQAHQARRLLRDARADEAAVLDGFRYGPVEVVTHHDERLLPARRRDWSPVNLFVDPAHPAPESTIWVNAVQPALRHAPPVFQTVHPAREPAPQLVIGRARFERPRVDAGSLVALRGLSRLHEERERRVWFCGSYAEAGIPLLESAVRSAAAVATRLGSGPEAAAATG